MKYFCVRFYRLSQLFNTYLTSYVDLLLVSVLNPETRCYGYFLSTVQSTLVHQKNVRNYVMMYEKESEQIFIMF